MRTTVKTFLLLLCSVLVMSGTIDLSNLFNYGNQNIPPYIVEDNTAGNPITDEGATLGRVLFYDKKLSSDNTIACASCHQQSFAFSDTSVLSQGVNGQTGRHSMRLINARFAAEDHFFWDERADSLEMQVTMPIQDHLEMGFSGTNGDPNMADLLQKLDAIPYYNDLFYLAFGDTMITEDRMQKALAQFVRSIQSFDSKFDQGLAAVNGNLNANFPNFTQDENTGKQLFLQPATFAGGANPTGNRTGGGLGCQGCHNAPEFDIAANSGNNGVITVANNPGATDLTITRSPSLRDMFDANGNLNGPLMHDGSMATFNAVLTHYNDITHNPIINPDLDPRLTGTAGPPGAGLPGPGQKLLMTAQERVAITAFMKTLTGSDVYTNVKWSNPFDSNGSLTLTGSVLSTIHPLVEAIEFTAFPNPVVGEVNFKGELENTRLVITTVQGQLLHDINVFDDFVRVDLSDLSTGIYLVSVYNEENQLVGNRKLIKQ